MMSRALDLALTSTLAALGAWALAAPSPAQTPDAPPPQGPGHYEESSGLRQSPGCGGTGFAYKFSTPPIAPGHVITNFHYELRGDNKCGQARRWKHFNASCELVTDKPAEKTVVFQLFTNRDQCFASETFESGGGESHGDSSVATGQHGAVTVSQMVFTYDVQ